jgi:hypothetical protein
MAERGQDMRDTATIQVAGEQAPGRELRAGAEAMEARVQRNRQVACSHGDGGYVQGMDLVWSTCCSRVLQWLPG